MASRWCGVKASWFIVACLSSVTGLCPVNDVVKVAVNDFIIDGKGVLAAQYPFQTSLKLSCLWSLEAPCSVSSPPQIPHVKLGGVPVPPSKPSCVCVLDQTSGDHKKWYEVSIPHVVEEGSTNYTCGFDGCSAANLYLQINSGPTSFGYSKCCLEQNISACRTSSTSGPPHTTGAPQTSDTTTHTTTTTTTGAATITGLNPLIYTLLAVILLGTASIVAMISCWMRHRRIMRRRREALFGREYLDFMGEQDFTTVTTNQLLASLAEAPPTYQQSEVIEQQLREAQDSSDEETPPPLPPRNTSTEGHQLEPEPPQAVSGAGETDGEGEGDKDDRAIGPISSDSEEEEESFSVKDGDSTALIR